MKAANRVKERYFFSALLHLQTVGRGVVSNINIYTPTDAFRKSPPESNLLSGIKITLKLLAVERSIVVSPTELERN